MSITNSSSPFRLNTNLIQTPRFWMPLSIKIKILYLCLIRLWQCETTDKEKEFSGFNFYNFVFLKHLLLRKKFFNPFNRRHWILVKGGKSQRSHLNFYSAATQLKLLNLNLNFKVYRWRQFQVIFENVSYAPSRFKQCMFEKNEKTGRNCKKTGLVLVFCLFLFWLFKVIEFLRFDLIVWPFG
jgi:hypothetical protein